MLPAAKPRSMFRRGLEVFVENKLAIVGVVILVLIFAFCYLGPLFYHTDQVHVNLANENLPPGPGHPLGTDQNGYDVLGRLMVGGQISLEVGLAAAVLATVLGTLWGAIAGYFGGITDAVMMRLVDALLAIPTLFLALVVVSMFPPTETELILVIALTSWLTTSRLIRGEALSLRVRDYVQAMQVMGGGSARAVFRHIAPNAIGTIIVNATFQVADAILLDRRAVLPGPRHPAAADRLGRHAQRRHQLDLRRLLVADLPGRHRDHPRRHRHQLHR